MGVVDLAVDAIASVTTRQQLADLFARSHGSLGLKPLIVAVDFDRNRVGKTLVSIETSGVSLGAREIYLDPAYAAVRQAQLAHVARLFRVAGLLW